MFQAMISELKALLLKRNGLARSLATTGCVVFFFFSSRRRHTRFDCDWSSDVCSSDLHPSGTDRVWEVAQSRAADVYVNVQGDEPFVTPSHIARLLDPFRERADTQVATLKIRLRPEEADNPAVNKVVCAADGHALYFSKYPVPYDRDARGVPRFKHVGLYAYTRAALEAFHRLPPSPLEQAEKLEQLRFLEHGVPIVVLD